MAIANLSKRALDMLNRAVRSRARSFFVAKMAASQKKSASRWHTTGEWPFNAIRFFALFFVSIFGFASTESNPYFITTVAGNGNRLSTGDGGSATGAAMLPTAVAVDVLGNFYIADIFNHRILKATSAGMITTVAGGGSGGDGGAAVAARLGFPTGVAIDSSGSLFIADYGSNTIRKVSVNGFITTVAGTGRCGSTGDQGLATTADICLPEIAVDASGNLYISDAQNHRVRKAIPGGIITAVAGSGPLDGNGAFSGDGGLATAAMLSKPLAVAVDASGNIFIADTGNNRIRKVTAGGIISTVAGSGPAGFAGGFSGDGGLATGAMLSKPSAVAVDVFGNLFIADTGNNRIRIVTAAGVISTVAGSGPAGSAGGFSGDGGLATAAQLSGPTGVAIDSSGNLFIADYGNNRVRELSVGPGITIGGVVNAASAVGGPVAPGEFVTIYGLGLGPVVPVLSDGLAQGLANTRVFFNGIEAFTTYVSSGQINAIVPFGVVGSSRAELQVEYRGVPGNRVSLPVADAVPGIFTTNGAGIGPAVVVNQDGTFNSASNPASRGSIISFWATGQGQTIPAGIDGMQPQPPAFPIPVLPVSVTIGGIAVPQSDIFFAGLVYDGVMQVNARVPATVPPGNLAELLLQVGNSTSIQGVTLPAVTLSVR